MLEYLGESPLRLHLNHPDFMAARYLAAKKNAPVTKTRQLGVMVNRR
jgi:hypothetical protein